MLCPSAMAALAGQASQHGCGWWLLPCMQSECSSTWASGTCMAMSHVQVSKYTWRWQCWTRDRAPDSSHPFYAYLPGSATAVQPEHE
jgi:hypothetical protein